MLARITGWCERLLARVERLASKREQGQSLALMRMLIGFALVLEMGRYCLMNDGTDVLVFSFADASEGGYREVEATLLLDLLGGAHPAALLGLAWCNLICGVLLLLGLFGRLPAMVAWLLTASLLGPPAISGGSDLLLQTSLFTLGLSDCTRTLSLDARIRTGSFVSADLVPAWPRQLALWQLCVMYGATGMQKLVSTAWLPTDDFSALYQILQSPHWARFPALMLDAQGAFVIPAAIATALTISWEITFPLVLFVRRLRVPFALVGLALHLGIWVTMEVGLFSLLSLAFYPTLFPACFSARGLGGGPVFRLRAKRDSPAEKPREVLS